MIILDKPYVSDLMQDSLKRYKIPVLLNDEAKKLSLQKEFNFIEETAFIQQFQENPNLFLYSNSENAIGWISKHLNFTDIPEKIELFKDKVKFRKLIQPLFPDFFFEELDFSELDGFNTNKLIFPCIIKPSVGFFSLGVYKVNSRQEWVDVINQIKKEQEEANTHYPKSVINSAKFILEENIEGDEFAIDAYFDQNGKPVILNILEHKFPHADNLDDRAYITSKTIIEKYHHHFDYLLTKIGALTKLKNFPIHIEVRVNSKGEVIPIEVNPMRFTGWCLTDIAHFAYGINVYDFYINQKKPNWEEILKEKDGLIYSMIIATLPKDINAEEVEKIDYEKFYNHFNKPLELRKLNYKEYPVFAFLFSETKESNWQEIESILKSDLKEFIQLK